jgi:subtilisin family serine protease
MSVRRRLPAALVALTALALGAASLAAAPAPSETRAPYLVRFVDGVDARAEAATAARAGARVSHVYTNVFPGFAAELPAAAVTALSRNPRVASIEADGVVTVASGTQTSATWGLDRIDQRDLPLDSRYSYPSTGAGVTAYIIDTGVLASHTDFGGRVTAGYTAISDGRGSSDCDGHGTHVAGTVGGATWGVAKAVTIVPVRVLDCNGSGTWGGVVAGIDWVVGHHVGTAPAVANLSLGGGANSTVDAAVQRMIDDGVTSVVAAGNDNRNACNYSPARVGAAVTVGATTSSDARASYSNFGSCLDLFAPGSSIRSAWHTSTTATSTISGTSMAAPHVAGAAALILAGSPGRTPSQVASDLAANATTGKVTSAGRGSPNRLVFVPGAVVASPLAVTTTGLPTGTVGAPYSVTLTSSGGTGSVRTWSITGGTVLPADLTLAGATISGTPSAAGSTTVTVQVSDGTSSASATFTLVIDPAPVLSVVDASVATSLSGGRWLAASATVTVTSGGTPTSGVLVQGRWYLNGSTSPLGSTVSGTTGSTGTVVLSSSTVKTSSGTLRFCVDRLSGTGVQERTFSQFERCGDPVTK